MFIVLQTLFVCLSLVRVPESTVNWGSGFLSGGRVYSEGTSEGGVRKGVVFRNLGLFCQRFSAMVTKPLIKEFLKSWRVCFFDS